MPNYSSLLQYTDHVRLFEPFVVNILWLLLAILEFSVGAVGGPSHFVDLKEKVRIQHV
jgi:hypothetical protein